MLNDLLIQLFGTLIGAYIMAAILFRDINVKRGVFKWVDSIVKDAFKEMR